MEETRETRPSETTNNGSVAPSAPSAPAPSRPRYEGPRGPRPERGQRRGRFGPRPPKVCPFCSQKVKYIDYKTADQLRRYLTDHGKIKARRKIGTCAKHQRRLALAIKRARHVALLPFTTEASRGE
jgi:small subunit ribosomal protein S18